MGHCLRERAERGWHAGGRAPRRGPGRAARPVEDADRWHLPERDGSAAVHWEVATGLRRLGVARGDRVTVVGSGLGAARWARLARVKIVAELLWQD